MPARQPYRAPEHICRFFESFRGALDGALTPELRALHCCMNAEERGGGKSGRKQHLHNSRFDDMRRGFIYEFWPNDLDVPRTGDSAAIGLFFEPKPFPVGAENFLRPILQSGDTAVRIRDLGFDVDAGLPVNERDRNTGVWLAKQTVALKGWRSPEVAIDCGRKLGKLMCIVHPVVRSMVERRFPSLMK